ncbi:MAG TPA: MarC family protein [Candidatus Tumulicola sp.]|jgi:multiple antibiotic resistance protein
MSGLPSEVFYSFVTLLAMVNPVEAAAAFATLTAGRSPADQAKIALRAALVGGLILIAFGYAGEALLKALGISMPAFKVAGGLLLLKVGFDMVFAQQTSSDTADTEKARAPASDPSVFPLAIPIISGPGALTASVALVNRAHENQVLTDAFFILIAAVVFAITYVAMRGSQRLTQLLGKTGVDATGRLVGIIVAAIAVQLIVDGAGAIVHAAFPR